jgi:hypothetical protein
MAKGATEMSAKVTGLAAFTKRGAVQPEISATTEDQDSGTGRQRAKKEVVALTLTRACQSWPSRIASWRLDVNA